MDARTDQPPFAFFADLRRILPRQELPLPHLDDRLKAVAHQIRCCVHADIGSDRGHLLKALLNAGRIERGIAIENKRQPFANSKATLAGLDAEVRFADGLQGLRTSEADSLSICGMGGESVVRILQAFPERIPSFVVLQPNRQPELVRQWGLRSGFHLVDEQIAIGHWAYVILRFERADASTDPAYAGLDPEAALLFGPHLCRRGRNRELTCKMREKTLCMGAASTTQTKGCNMFKFFAKTTLALSASVAFFSQALCTTPLQAESSDRPNIDTKSKLSFRKDTSGQLKESSPSR